jgi:uncharacterized glyoxalase superfamily protein PhnB
MSIQPLISVRDVAASVAFYTDLLGFTLEGEPLPGQDGHPVFAVVKYGTTNLNLDHTEYDELPPNIPVGVGVDLYISLAEDVDIDALYARVQAAGVTIIQSLRQQFWGDKRFVIQDPDGYRLSLAQNVQTVSHDEMSDYTRIY